jgi:hypothetical protein
MLPFRQRVQGAAVGLVVVHQSICEVWWLHFAVEFEKGGNTMLNVIALDWAVGSIPTRDVDDIEGKEAWRLATIARPVDGSSS